MKNIELIPNKSYGIFNIGNDIKKYLYLPHVMEHRDEKSFSYDSYDFYKENLTIWVNNDKIETIRCDTKCYWKGRNLIGMLYEDFLDLANQLPNGEDVIYVPSSPDRGQNQKVYDFNSLGLQIWVWRNRIKTVLISRYDQEE